MEDPGEGEEEITLKKAGGQTTEVRFSWADKTEQMHQEALKEAVAQEIRGTRLAKQVKAGAKSANSRRRGLQKAEGK